MSQPKDLTGHIQKIFDQEDGSDGSTSTTISVQPRPFASDRFSWFVYGVLALAALAEAALIIGMDLL